jgi:hypothetical protein
VNLYRGDELLDLFRQIEGTHQTAIGQFEEDEAFIAAPWNEGWGVGIIPSQWEDDGLRITAPPTAHTAVQTAADHMLSVPRISVPVRPSETEQEKQHEIAEKKADFLRMCWQKFFEECGDPFGRGKKSIILGKLVLKLELKWELLPELPDDPTPAEKRKYRNQVEKVCRSTFLWRLRLIPKETGFPVGDRWDPKGYFESYETTAIQARSRYAGMEAVEEALKDKDAQSKVRYLEYWSKPHGSDRGQYIQWLDGTRIHEDINPYSWEGPLSTDDEPQWDGYIPYVTVASGFGDDGAEDKPEDVYVSILRPNRSVMRAETRLLTEMESYLRMYIWPHLLTKNMPDLEDGEQQIKLGPGGHTNLTEDQAADVLKWGEMPVSLLQGLQRVNQYVDSSTHFGTLSGGIQRGVDTASEADMNVRNAATSLSGPVRGMRWAAMTIDSWLLMCIDNVVEAPVTVSGALEHGPSEVTLTPREINGFYATSVEMETSDEAALNLRNARTWSDLAQRMPISFRTAMEKAGITNPTQEMEERAIEDLERSPQAMQVLTMMYLAGLGEAGQIARDAYARTLQETGQGPPSASGLPPSAGGAPPATPGQPGQMPPQQPNMVDQFRNGAQQAAQQAAPERSFY